MNGKQAQQVMDKKEAAQILEEIAVLLELKGENPFKTRAYQNAARAVLALEGSLDEAVRSGELTRIKGIGKALAEKLTELVTTGKLSYYEELKEAVPRGLLEMIAIPGLGPRKAKTIYEKLGISTLSALEQACRDGRIAKLPGFASRTQQKIIEGIEYLKKHRDRFLYSEALAEAQELLAQIESRPETIRSSIAGSLRRAMETVKDIDIVAGTHDPEALMDFFVSVPQARSVVACGKTKSTIRLASGINADLRAVKEKEFPYALHHFTGSKAHNTALRSRAKSMGLKMNEYGLFRSEHSLPARDEAEIFAHLGLSYIPPELREDRGEIEAAASGSLPELVTMRDMRGVLHVHTKWSDGSAPLEEMAKAARELGYRYLGIADHSKSAYYAGGLSEEEIYEQHSAIDELNGKLRGIVILKGIESDILPDGSLDYSEKVLESFDFVIASVHSSFGLSRERMTRRIIQAMKNPFVDILGHPTGRLLLVRDAYEVDLEAVLEAAADLGVAMELNAHPQRLDLDWRWGNLARSLGVKIAINPDAHHVEGLEDVRYGVGIARKGWFSRSDVLNCMSVSEFRTCLRRRRG